MKTFWRTWMMLLGDAMIVIGLAMVLAPSSALFAPINEPAWATIFGTAALGPEAQAYHDFAVGLAGAATIGWGILVFFLAWKALPTGAAWVWQALALSLVGWFVIDTVHVLTFGVYSFALFNLMMAVAAVPALIGLALQPRRVEGALMKA